MYCAPIILFVYNRLDHTRQTVEALAQNTLADQSELFIFADAPRTPADPAVAAVRDYIKTIRGFKNVQVVARQHSYGLAKSIISGVTEVLKEYGRCIVVEDDLVSSPYFLEYMNHFLEFYKKDPKVFSVTGYNFPKDRMAFPKSYKYSVYFNYRCMSWSWATWLERWEKVDWAVRDYKEFMSDLQAQGRFNRGGADLTGMLNNQQLGKINSWAIRWCYAHYKNDAYCLYPVDSLIKNIGFDGSGTHCHETKDYETRLLEKPNALVVPPQTAAEPALMRQMVHMYLRPTFKTKAKIWVKSLLDKR